MTKRHVMLLISVVCIIFYYLYHLNQQTIMIKMINKSLIEIEKLNDEYQKYTILYLKATTPEQLLTVSKQHGYVLLKNLNTI